MKPRAILFNEASTKPQFYRKQILAKISQVIRRGSYLLGPENEKLEKKLAQYLRGGCATAVGSGHDALALSLFVLGLTKDDEIIFPANALPVAYPVCLSGAKPVAVDVDQNGQLDPQALVKKINQRTKAVIVVHLYGLVGNLDQILEITKKAKITLIEDCAQALGSLYQNQPVGTFAEISCFSFYPTKNLGTVGDGGAIWTRNLKYQQFFQQARIYGERYKHWSDFLSGHSRLPEIQAAVLNLYFSKIKQEIAQRKTIFSWYRQAISGARLIKFIRLFDSVPNSVPAPHLLVVEVKYRDKLKQFLAKNHIPTTIHYPYGLWQIPGFSSLHLEVKDFPMTAKLTRSILSLPFHPHLRQNEIRYIVNIMQKFYGV